MAYRFSSVELRSQAARLESVAGDVFDLRAHILALLSIVGRCSGSTDALAGVVSGAHSRAIDLDARAQFIDDYQLGRVTLTDLGRLHPVTGSSSASEIAAAVSELQTRLDTWTGTDNDPILDAMVRDLHDLEAQLGLTVDDALAVAAAMIDARPPGEAGLPDWLFPPWYLDAVASHRAGDALVGALEARRRSLSKRYDDITSRQTAALIAGDHNVDIDALAAELGGIEVDLETVASQLDAARSSLVPVPSAHPMIIYDHLLTLPLGHVARREAAGAFLARRHLEAVASEDYATLVLIGRRLAAPDVSPITAAAFYNVLGVGAVSQIPDFIFQTTSTTGANVVRNPALPPPGDVIEWYSVALGAASRSGRLDFTGAELIHVDVVRWGHAEDIYFSQLDASYLLLAVDSISSDFLVSAAAEYLPYATNATHKAELVNRGGGLPLAMRGVLLQEIVARGLGPELVASIDDATVLVDPIGPFAVEDEDTYGAISAVYAQVVDSVDPETGKPTTTAVEAAENLLATAARGIGSWFAALVLAVLATHFDALIPDAADPTRYREAIEADLDSTSAIDVDPAILDGVIHHLVRSPARHQLHAVYLQYVAHVFSTIVRTGDALELKSIDEDLGNLWGRILDIELDADIGEAQSQDNAQKWTAIGVGAVTSFMLSFVFPSSWPAVVSALGGTGLGVITGQLTDAGWPTDHVEYTLAAEIDSASVRQDVLLYVVVTALIQTGALVDVPMPPPPPTGDSSEAEMDAWDATLIEWRRDLERAGEEEPDGLVQVVLDAVASVTSTSAHSIDVGD